MRIQQQALARRTVAARAACLLVVALDRGGQTIVKDASDVGLVNAHTKCRGRHEDVQVVSGKCSVGGLSHVIRQTGVVQAHTQGHAHR